VQELVWVSLSSYFYLNTVFPVFSNSYIQTYACRNWKGCHLSLIKLNWEFGIIPLNSGNSILLELLFQVKHESEGPQSFMRNLWSVSTALVVQTISVVILSICSPNNMNAGLMVIWMCHGFQRPPQMQYWS